MGVDGVPVADIEQGRYGVAAKGREIDQPVGACSTEAGVEQEVERQCGYQEKQGGEQALGPPGPERRQLDRAGPHPLLEQERRDEKPRKHEEEVDPEISP